MLHSKLCTASPNSLPAYQCYWHCNESTRVVVVTGKIKCLLLMIFGQGKPKFYLLRTHEYGAHCKSYLGIRNESLSVFILSVLAMNELCGMMCYYNLLM